MPHAGEDSGPRSVWGAIDALKAERIMHGVRAVDDPDLVRELAKRRVPLAVCLHSNVRLGVARSIEEHPLRTLWDAGVLVSVNTDDPGYFECSMVDEFAAAGRLLGLDREGYGRLASNSVESSFASDQLKAEMQSEIAAWVKRG